MNIQLTDKQIKKQQYNKNHTDKLKSIQLDGTYKRYQQGKVYAIRSHNSPLIYIGSTYRPCSYRFSTHKYDYKRYIGSNHTKPYTSSFDVIKNGDCYFEILEYVNCETRQQLEDRERFYIHLNSTVCTNRNNILKKEQIIVKLQEMINLAEDLLVAEDIYKL